MLEKARPVNAAEKTGAVCRRHPSLVGSLLGLYPDSRLKRCPNALGFYMAGFCPVASQTADAALAGLARKSMRAPCDGESHATRTPRPSASRGVRGGSLLHKPLATRSLEPICPGPRRSLSAYPLRLSRGAPQQIRPLTPQHALTGFTPTPTHLGALHARARPCPLLRHRPHAQRSRPHFIPQHWLLCHI